MLINPEKWKKRLSFATSAVQKLGGLITDIVKFSLIEAEAERSFVVIVIKRSITAKRYPRKAGMPSKEPLK